MNDAGQREALDALRRLSSLPEMQRHYFVVAVIQRPGRPFDVACHPPYFRPRAEEKV